MRIFIYRTVLYHYFFAALYVQNLAVAVIQKIYLQVERPAFHDGALTM